MPRKTPILLRPASFTGEIMALYQYRTKTLPDGHTVLTCDDNGRQDVTGDFDHIVLDLLMGDAADICAALDGAAQGMELNEEERGQIRAFRTALVKIIERHNARLADSSDHDSPAREGAAR